MSVTERMMGLLGEPDKQKAQEQAVAKVAEEAAVALPADMESTTDLAAKAANVLVVGLHGDLPDEPDAAIDILMDVMKQLRGAKKTALQKAMRRMKTNSRALATIRDIKKSY